LNGNGSDNILVGASASDILNGNGGNDVLLGGGGGDTLSGGAGADILNGGAGSDSFVFAAVSESGTTIANRDVIQDFLMGTDKITLTGIDADPGAANDQAFAWDGAVASNATLAVGHLGYYQSGGHTYIVGHVAGAANDFGIDLVGTYALTGTDFNL
jgi:Ca2+-binding RTX toxin-like protein